jgi:hypothetical protein
MKFRLEQKLDELLAWVEAAALDALTREVESEPGADEKRFSTQRALTLAG